MTLAKADLLVYTHRHSPLLVDCVSSIAAHTKASYRIITVIEDGSCHENMKRALDRSDHRYVVFIDEDVVMVQDQWLDHLIETLESNPGYGALCSVQYRHPVDSPADEELALAAELYNNLPPHVIGKVQWCPWIPCHTMIIDRDRCPHMEPDVHIPGRIAMTDVDLSYQVRHDNGNDVGLAISSIVVHRDKGHIPIEYEREKAHRLQAAYMAQKWSKPVELLDPTPHDDPEVQAWIKEHLWETRYRGGVNIAPD